MLIYNSLFIQKTEIWCHFSQYLDVHTWTSPKDSFFFRNSFLFFTQESKGIIFKLLPNISNNIKKAQDIKIILKQKYPGAFLKSLAYILYWLPDHSSENIYHLWILQPSGLPRKQMF